MKRSYSTLFCTVVMLALASTAFAEAKVSDVPEEVTPMTGPNCDLTNYKSEVVVLSPAVAIPDNNAAGVILPPIVTPPDGSIIVDVILDLRAASTWIGDLVATLSYDINCDGTVEAATRVLCRPGRTAAQGCAGQGTPFGCSGDFSCNNELRFSDAALAPMGCTVPIAPGCYLPSGPGAGPMSVFNGLIKGGCWYLGVQDMAGGDLASICQWSLHTLNEGPVSTASKTWGGVKSIYR